ncbi:MAG: class I SAM-dependent methyltransferase, partial [Planctomycetota bacterium]
MASTDSVSQHAALLVVTGERLELREPTSPKSPVFCDFLGGSFGHRRSTGRLRGELIAKAVGYKGQPLDVIDTTSGL